MSRPRPKMPSRGGSKRWPRAGSVLLGLQCAFWIAVSPVVPQLHQVFAAHRHIYCLEHHQIEDAGPRLFRAAAPVRAHGQDAIGHSPAGRAEAHRVCLFSSYSVPASLGRVGVSDEGVPYSAPNVPGTLALPDYSASSILLVAPKQSPPANNA